MEQSHLQHLYWRAGFGLGHDQLKDLEKQKLKKVIKALFEQSIPSSRLKIDLSEINLFLEETELTIKQHNGSKFYSNLKKIAHFKKIELNAAWIDRLATTNEMLREKMTLFWSNIFICDDDNVHNLQHYQNTLRTNALGNFGELVESVVHEASIINSYNLPSNRKGHPDTEFTRALLDVFLLGEGNATERDITEAAKAFTGWNVDLRGNFQYDREQHDDSQKMVFGRKDDYDGKDIIKIALKKKQCAHYICDKVYKYFVNPKVNHKHLEEITELFYIDYNISTLMRHIFSSEWFYNEENIGVKIKSPIELLVGIKRTVPYSFAYKPNLFYLQKMMGQTLLEPHNTFEWKGDRDWINPNTLMFRLNLPILLLNSGDINLDENGELTSNFTDYYKQKRGKLNAEVFWRDFEKEYNGVDTKTLRKILLNSGLNTDTRVLIYNFNSPTNKIFCIKIMSLPEYQLC